MHSLAVVYVLLVFYDPNRQLASISLEVDDADDDENGSFYISLRNINM